MSRILAMLGIAVGWPRQVNQAHHAYAELSESLSTGNKWDMMFAKIAIQKPMVCKQYLGNFVLTLTHRKFIANLRFAQHHLLAEHNDCRLTTSASPVQQQIDQTHS
ncbi:hypothetical protein Tco_0749272 [Tanacetum coccineum]|uniref:Uncharacterized protein n=1 Tax=Tanacetum coccineum TaxID=301880 RepID=A0ABQ4YYY7_9ASTR